MLQIIKKHIQIFVPKSMKFPTLQKSSSANTLPSPPSQGENEENKILGSDRRRKCIGKRTKKSTKTSKMANNGRLKEREQNKKERDDMIEQSEFTSGRVERESYGQQVCSGVGICEYFVLDQCQNCTQKRERAFEYCGQIEKSLLEREQRYIPLPLKDDSEIGCYNRTQLIQWLFAVSEKFNFKQNTAFLSVSILDRTLGLTNVDTTQLHLLAITSLFIAAKYEEIPTPKVGDFVFLGKGSSLVSKDSILRMEGAILLMLEFDLSYISPVYFLDLFCAQRPLTREERNKVTTRIKKVMMENEKRGWNSSRIAKYCYSRMNLQNIEGVFE